MLKRLITIPLFGLFIMMNIYWYKHHIDLDIYKQMFIVFSSICIYLAATMIEVVYASNNHVRIILFKVFITGLIIYYGIFLCAVLFLDGYFFSRSQETYVNKIPFYTIRKFFNFMRYNNDLRAFANLVGNAILFAPFGLLLPLWLKCFKNPILFTITITFMVSIVEYMQHYFSIGGADVDDIILNVLGALMVFVVYKFVYFCVKDKIEIYFKDDKIKA